MAQRLGLAGFQNTGKSYSRRWIPDGENCIVVQPSIKASHLYTGPKNASKLSKEELDAAILSGERKMVGNFDAVSPDGKFSNLQEAANKLPNAGPHTNMFDALASLTKHKAPGYFKKEHITGNVLLAPEFWMLQEAVRFIDKHMPWIHTIILPDFTHFITEKITSDEFLNRKFGNEAFAKYNDLAAEAYKGFIKGSDTMRNDLVVITEFHAEWVEAKQRYELFLPGGQQMKNKFLPSSYYDMLLFTDIKYDEVDEEADPEYQYITRATPKYPEARSGGLYDTLRVPNNLQDALTRLRKQHNIELK